jgi:hypothetical protein
MERLMSSWSQLGYSHLGEACARHLPVHKILILFSGEKSYLMAFWLITKSCTGCLWVICLVELEWVLFGSVKPEALEKSWNFNLADACVQIQNENLSAHRNNVFLLTQLAQRQVVQIENMRNTCMLIQTSREPTEVPTWVSIMFLVCLLISHVESKR